MADGASDITKGDIMTRPLTHRLAGAAVLLVALTVLARPAAALPVPSTPGEMIEELNAALNGQAEIYNWRSKLDPTYNSWKVGGSQNLPVIASAIGLIRGGLFPPFRRRSNEPLSFSLSQPSAPARSRSWESISDQARSSSL